MNWARVAIFVGFVVTVGACAGSTVDEAEAPVPTALPETAASPQPEPTETLVTCPRPVDPVATADLDGDGMDETLTIEAIDGAQQFVACRDGGAQALALELGTWYVAVFNAESGNADEVFLGGPHVDDLPETPRASLVWFDPAQSLLRPDRRVSLNETSDLQRLVELVRVPPPASICDGDHLSLEVDIDGDGLRDKVVRRQTGGSSVFSGGPTITVCTAAGATDEVLVAGLGEIFMVSEGTGDRPTIWSGGATASAALFDPFVFVDGRIRPLRADGDPIPLADGSEWPDARRKFGCADLTGDGVLELVQLDGVRDRDEIRWIRRSWETVADRAELVTETTGRLRWPRPAEGEQSEEPPAAFDDLAGSWDDCGWLAS